MLFPLCVALRKIHAAIDGENFLVCNNGDGGDGGDGSVGGGGSASASIGDTGGGGSISGDAGSIGGGGTASAGDTGGLSADDSEGPGEGVGSSIAAAALSAQADAQAAMGNLGFGAVGADLSGPNANLASPQDAINDAFGQFGYAPTTTSQQDEAATYGYMSNLNNFTAPTAPPSTAPTPAELGTPTAPPGMTDEEAAAAQNSMQGLFGIAPAPAPAPSPFGQLASFEGPNATVSGKSATSAQDAADALSDEQDSIAAQNIAAFNLAQQEQEAKALDQQFNPQPTPVPTVAVAPEDMPTAPLNQDVDPAQTIADQAKEAKAAVQAIDNALAAPLGKGGIGADATAAPGPATAADLSDAVATALGTLSPTVADALGEQGKAALAAAMNNALGQFGPPAPPAPAPTGKGGIGSDAVAAPTAPAVAAPAALPGPATSIGTPAVAASFQGFSQSPQSSIPSVPNPASISTFGAPPSGQVGPNATINDAALSPSAISPSPTGFTSAPTVGPNINGFSLPASAVTADAAAHGFADSNATGFVGPNNVNQGQVSLGPPAAPPAPINPMESPLSPFNMPFPTPLSPQQQVPLPTARPDIAPPPQISVPLPTARPDTAPQAQVPSQADSLAAAAAAQAKAALDAAQAAKGFTPSPNMFGAPASGNIGAPAVGTSPAPVGPPSSFGQLGSNISGFAPGSGLGSFAAAAAETGPVAAQAVSVGFPPTAAIAMQSLYNTPLRA